MRLRNQLAAAVSAATAIGSVIALASAGGAGAAPTPITLGSTTGDPSMNVGSCAAMITCTFVPFDSVAAPSLVAPADGTITSFSLNAGSAGATVKLRVLRPAGAGRFTGVGTSPTETTSGGVQAFSVNLPVHAGDVLGLDNDTSALLFDGTDTAHPLVGYYIPHPLSDGASAVPDRVATGLRLLLSAVEQPSGTTTSTSTTTTSATPPSLSSVSQSATAWRSSGRAARHRPPVGTTFSFRLNEPASVTISFFAAGRTLTGKGHLTVAERAGTSRVAFRGTSPHLGPGTYSAVFTATNSARQTSPPAALTFSVVR